VNLETFSSQGGFAGLEARLGELKALGVGILWLMPIQERGVLKAFGSPYCVKDYYRLHRPYGSEADFKRLVRAIHAQGLHVVLDWVPNHSAWDNPLIKAHPEFYLHDAHGAIQQASTWTDVAQFDYRQAGLRRWMTAAMRHWVRAFDIDGFRCDVAWNVPIDFWVSARQALERDKPLFMLAESNEARDQEAFDADYDWNLMNLGPQCPLVEIAAGHRPATDIDPFVQQDLRRFKAPFTRLRYTSNHDEWKDQGTPSVRFQGGDRAFAVLTACLPGRPLLYNGQEIGWQQQKGPIDWSPSARGLSYTAFYTRLLRLRREDAALRTGRFLKLSSDQDRSIYAFVRQEGAQRVLVVLNLSPRAQDFRLKGEGLQGTYADAFSGDTRVLGPEAHLRLEPWGYELLLDSAAAVLSPEPTPVPRVAPLALAACTSPFQPLGRGAPAAFRVRWDAQRLNVDFEFDKAPVVHLAPDDRPWEDDSVELYLDLKHDRSPDSSDADFQYIVGFGNPRLFEARGRTAGVEFSSTTGSARSLASLAIPWKLLGVRPQKGSVFGFDVAVNLDKGSGHRDASFQWSGNDQNYRDTSLFGDLKLGDACPTGAIK
jgi:glycosidase